MGATAGYWGRSWPALRAGDGYLEGGGGSPLQRAADDGSLEGGGAPGYPG